MSPGDWIIKKSSSRLILPHTIHYGIFPYIWLIFMVNVVNMPYIDCLGSVEVVPKDLAWETKKQLQRLTEIPTTTDRHWTVTVTVYKRRNFRKTKPALPTGFENCFHMNISSLQVFILSVMLKISSSIGNGRKHICLLSNLPSGRFVYWIYDSEFCLESARIQTPKITLAFFKRGSTFSVHG